MIYKVNNYALALLDEGKFSEALQLFKKNAKQFPSLMTFNNLGEFYFQFGNSSKNGKWISAKKLGYLYLLKAYSKGKDAVNIENIAQSLVEMKKFREALPFFEEAALLSQTMSCQYNVGICYFNLGLYECALTKLLPVFSCVSDKEKGHTEEMNDAISTTDLATVIVFSYLYTAQEEKANKFFQFCLQSGIDIDIYERFFLNFALKKYSDVLVLTENVLREYFPTDIIIAMIAEALLQKPDCLSEEERNQLLCECRSDSGSLEKALQGQQWRQNTINSFVYTAPFVQICGFYGCKKHHVEMPQI